MANQDLLDTVKLGSTGSSAGSSTGSSSSIQLDVAVWSPPAFIFDPLSFCFIYIHALNLRLFLLILFADDTIFISLNASVASLIVVLYDV